MTKKEIKIKEHIKHLEAELDILEGRILMLYDEEETKEKIEFRTQLEKREKAMWLMLDILRDQEVCLMCHKQERLGLK